MNPKLKLERIHGDMLEVYDMEFIRLQNIDWVCAESQGDYFTSDYKFVIRATIAGSNSSAILGRYEPDDYLTEDEKSFIRWTGHIPPYYNHNEICEAQTKARSLVFNARHAAEEEAHDDLLAFITAISNKGVSIEC